jgi:predicted DNA-binding transcriptional regulator YafY
MRADRLLAMLMLLQTRGRLTAAELAGKLEVSVRTVYRDLEALSVAGVPVYAERGPGGGCGLIDSYRTTLTGLTQEELQALFMLSIPAPLAELGISGELRAALLKLSAALPAGSRREEERVRGRIHLDWEGWTRAQQPAPFLPVAHRAVWTDRMLRIRFRRYFGTEVEKVVHPLGLVAKAGAWHLVCRQDGNLRVHPVSELLDAEMCSEACQRPADFDLERFWESHCREWESSRPCLAVTALVQPGSLGLLRSATGQALEAAWVELWPARADGRREVTLVFETFEQARSQLLACGGAVEVLEPVSLRWSIADFAEQVRARYAGGGTG